MKAHELDDKSLRKDIYKLRRELRASIQEIKGLASADPLIPTDAIKKMAELERKMRKTSVKKMTTDELTKTYRNLKYIRGLKSSTVEGATTTGRRFESIRKNISSLSPKMRDEWWSVYAKLYEENSAMEKFKYEIFDVVDSVFGSVDTDAIISNIIEKSRELMRTSYKDEEKYELRFAEFLKEFRKLDI